MVNYIQGSGLPQSGALGNPWAVLKHKPVEYERVKEITKNTLNVSNDTLPSSEQGAIVPYLVGTKLITRPLVMTYGFGENHGITPNYETHTEETTEDELVVSHQAGVGGSMVGENSGWRSDYFGEMPTQGFIPGRLSDYEVVKPGLLTFGGVIGTTYGASYIAGDWSATLKNHTVNTVTTLVDYTFDFVLALCLGPQTRLRKIYQGKTLIWEGDVKDGDEVDCRSLTDQPLGEGFIFRSGGYDQEPDDYLKAKAKNPDDVPAYKGISYIIIKNIKSGAASQGQLSFECTRLPNYFEVPDEVLSPNGYDMNVALAAYAVVYEDWAGLGVLGSDINKQSFLDAMTVLHSEKQKCSMLIASDDMQGVLRSLENQADSVLYASPRDGKITYKLYRDNVSTKGVKVAFGPGNVSDVQSYQRVDWSDLPTHFKVTYNSRPDVYEVHNDVEPNPSQPPQLYRSRRVGNVDLTATINEKESADASMLQFMKRYSAPTLTMTLVTNRDGAELEPTDIISLDWPDMGWTDVLFFVLKQREGPDLESVLVDVAVYQFCNVTKFFAGVEASKFVPADTGAKDVPTMRIIELPYFLLKKNGLSSRYFMPSPYGEAVVLAEAANEYQSHFSLINADTKLLTKEGMKFSPTAQLVAPMKRTDGYQEGVIPVVRLKNFKLSGQMIMTQDADARARGDNVIFLNDEILTYTSIEIDADNPGEYLMKGVYRALIDTIEADHAADDMLYFWNTSDNSRIWAGGVKVQEESRNLTPLSSTLDGQLDIADANLVIHYEPYGRSIYPLRPHYIQVNRQRRDDKRVRLVPGEQIDFTWHLRTRGDRELTFVNDPNDVPEVRQENTHWDRSPVVFVYFVGSDGFRRYIGNSMQNLEAYVRGDPGADYSLDPGPSTLTHIRFVVPNDVALGEGYFEFITSDYNYILLRSMAEGGADMQMNRAFGIPKFYVNIEAEPAFYVDFDFGWARECVADFSFEWLIDFLI